MRKAIVIVWVGCGGVFAVALVLASVSVVAAAADIGGPSLPTDARFFAAMLAPLMSLLALLAIGLGGLALLTLPEGERRLGKRSLLGGLVVLLASFAWLLVAVSFLGGGVVPH